VTGLSGTATGGVDTSSDTGLRPLSFFEAAYRASVRAIAVVRSSVDRCYSIAGRSVRLRFAGPSLLPLIAPALEHLRTESPADGGLTVLLWDTASTGVRMPTPPWPGDAYGARREVRGFNTQRILTTFDRKAAILNLLDCTRNLAIFWIRDAADVPHYETGSPLLPILHRWMYERGRQLLHAGAVGTPEGGVLLAGKGGSGKSTVALACIQSGLQYLSDDYCLLSLDPTPRAHSLYSSAKQDVANLHYFSGLAGEIANRARLSSEKALFLLQARHAARIAQSFAIQAILLPRVTGRRETALASASRAAAITALAPSTIFQLAGAGKATFDTIVRCVRQVPCYELNVGTDLAQVAQTVETLLQEIRRGTRVPEFA
jgi:hypothetical protein